ncbi:TPA: hypothetical protein DCQ22_00030 [Candidatus Nomurabacteria bacterium]|nr:hypothetical protein [Candidatus Nomurabacteria bacterium]
MVAKLFSNQDDAILIELYATKTNKELATILNNQYSSKQIKYRAKALKLHKDVDIVFKAHQLKTGAWEDWEKEIIRRHYSKEGLEFVCNLIPNRTKSSVLHKAHRMGYKIPNSIRKKIVGRPLITEETRIKMSLARRGKPFSEEHIKNIRLSAHRGKDHHMWKDGRSRMPYGEEFSVILKSEIKKRDHYQCQLCKKKPSWTKLIIHHIDYNKTNCSKQNLVTLCKACHVHHHLNTNDDEQKKEQELFNNYISGKFIVG